MPRYRVKWLQEMWVDVDADTAEIAGDLAWCEYYSDRNFGNDIGSSVTVTELPQRQYSLVGHEVWSYRVKASSHAEAIKMVTEEPYKYRDEMCEIMHVAVTDDEAIENATPVVG